MFKIHLFTLYCCIFKQKRSEKAVLVIHVKVISIWTANGDGVIFLK